MADDPWSPDDMIIVAAARRLAGQGTCFAGIGLPSAAAILAAHTHVPSLYIVFESGALGSRPPYFPLSVADEGLAGTAQLIVSVPEVFAYWLQAGRIDVGLLGAAQVDRFGNINSTVIGSYAAPRVRLPGAGGAPEIAAACHTTMILVRHDRRSLVAALDFVTTVGHGTGPGSRAGLGFPGLGPSAVITDLGVLVPHPETLELTLAELHPGATVEQVRAATGWELAVASPLGLAAAPMPDELRALRRLDRRATA
jgi:glutaconate CoA-transferase subunit B